MKPRAAAADDGAPPADEGSRESCGGRSTPASMIVGCPVVLFCNRCQTELQPGSGEFFEVLIQGVADPTPPEFTLEDLQRDVHHEMDELLAQLGNRSEQELMDDVVRRVVIHLCRSCFATWIEDPAG